MLIVAGAKALGNRQEDLSQETRTGCLDLMNDDGTAVSLVCPVSLSPEEGEVSSWTRKSTRAW
jgi:hypothetical protein